MWAQTQMINPKRIGTFWSALENQRCKRAPTMNLKEMSWKKQTWSKWTTQRDPNPQSRVKRWKTPRPVTFGCHWVARVLQLLVPTRMVAKWKNRRTQPADLKVAVLQARVVCKLLQSRQVSRTRMHCNFRATTARGQLRHRKFPSKWRQTWRKRVDASSHATPVLRQKQQQQSASL